MTKIALIDDEQMIQNLYSKFLSKDFEVVTAYDGEEGLALIEKEKPALILVDVRMPKMDGLAMVEEMRKRKITTPVLVLTNFVEDEKMAKAIEMGVTDYIAKYKLTPSQVLAKVHEVLKE